ncbi:MAG: hypothetical protein ACSHW1_15850 [Yoonia sp.]|uniref:hypothetical protein n=1 Tax=Yoonia sp. TaxID=2212373 RepID=UPI003EF7C9BB
MAVESGGNSTEYAQWIITVLTLLGLIAQHIWSRRSLITHRDQDQFDKHIADPARTLVSKIDAFSANIPLIEIGTPPSHAMMMSHAILVKTVNTFVSDSVASPVAGGNEWFQISTKGIEGGLPTDNAENTTALQIRQLIIELERLKGNIQDLTRGKRPM